MNRFRFAREPGHQGGFAEIEALASSNCSSRQTVASPSHSIPSANGPDPTPLNNTATDTDLILSDVSGFVYIDLNNDGVFAGADVPIEGVSVNLTGVDARGNAVNLTTTTGADGMYCFLDLAPGLYDIIESQPQQFLDGKDTPGQVADALGTQSQLNLQVLDDQFARLAVGSGVSAQDFNFGEQMVMPTKRRCIR